MSVVQINGVLKARKHQSITPTTSTGFTQTNYEVGGGLTGSDTNFKVLYAEEALVTTDTGTNGLRWTVDGTTPTISVGHYAAAGSSLTITGYENIRAFRCIDSGAAQTVKVTFFFRQ